MQKSDKSDNLKARVLEALEESLGIVTDACRKSNISRQSFYRWCKEDPDFKDKVDEIEDVALDFAESELHKQIRNGIPSSTIFYLKTKGKKRGFVERQELEHRGDLTTDTGLSHLTYEELYELKYGHSPGDTKSNKD